MGQVMQQFGQAAGVQSLRTSVCHPQTNGPVERFNGTFTHPAHICPPHASDMASVVSVGGGGGGATGIYRFCPFQLLCR